jgi:uncharacterized membrane protein
VPTSGNFTGYTKVGNCSCAACDLACPAPPVDGSIGFFDGFNGLLVLAVYAALIVFSIGYQFLRRKYFSGDVHSSTIGSDEPEVQNEDPQLGSGAVRRGGRKDKINESAISSNMSRADMSRVENSAQRLLEGGRRDE